MSYDKALEAAGAKLLAFEQFGSYQGDWWALVEYKGQRGWVTGSFGSCSGCDAFEEEFDWNWEEDPNNKEKLKSFGIRYLDPILTQEQALKEAAAHNWDEESINMIKFIEKKWEK